MADLFNLSVCSGAGMLDLALEIAFGIRTVCYVEREAYAAACLVARMEESSVEPAPIWCGDLEAFRFGKWRRAVDSLSAGFPCQPWSHAGKRGGEKDERWIWPAIAHGIRLSGAWLVFLENVPGLLDPRGIGRVLGDLAEMGFDAEWGVLSAGSVGAAHRRERVFILAYRRSERRQQNAGSTPSYEGENARRSAHAADEFASGSADVARAVGDGLEPGSVHAGFGGSGESAPEPERSGAALDDAAGARCNGARLGTNPDGGSGECVSRTRRAALADAERSGSQAGGELRAGPGQPDIGRRSETLADGACGLERGEPNGERQPVERRGDLNAGGETLADGGSERSQGIGPDRPAPGAIGRSGGAGIFAPGPNAAEWPAILERAPWLAPAVESGFRSVADGLAVVVDAARADQLRAIGNGVVPLQAACAFRILARRLGLLI